VVDPAHPAATRPPVDLAAGVGADPGANFVELTTVTTVSATFHRNTHVEVVDGLEPATHYEHHGIAYSTLPRPAGRMRCRVATVNDIHFGETEAGRIDDSGLGPIQRVPAGSPAYPEVMNRAAVAEMIDADNVHRLDAVIAKGDLTSEGLAEEFAAFEACYRVPFGDRLFAVRGNHDCPAGQTDYAGDQWIQLDGLSIALVDTVIPGRDHGQVHAVQVDWLDALANGATDPMIVMGHHPQYLGAADDDPAFSLTPESSAALSDVFARRPAIVAYTAGHTHRHRVQWAGGSLPSVEVGCVKDFPGTWAEYQVYDGGILQIVHRISSPEALAWSEQCRTLYADFGVDYTVYALGTLDDRCFVIYYR
jgi:3',5'-cyclic-AMP phosphodiesterase